MRANRTLKNCFFIAKLCKSNVLLGGAESIKRLYITQFTCFLQICQNHATGTNSRNVRARFNHITAVWHTTQMQCITFRVWHPTVNLDHHRPVFYDRLSASKNWLFCSVNCSLSALIISVSWPENATVFSIGQDQSPNKLLWSHCDSSRE